MIPKHPFPMLSEYKSEHRDRVIVVLPPSITTTVRPVEEKPKIIVVLPPVAKILPTPFPSVKRQGGPKPNLSPRKGPKVVQTSKSVTTKSPLQYKFRQPTTIQKIFSYQTQKPPPSPKPFDPFSLSPKTFTSSPLAPATATVTLTDDLTIQPASATVETGLTTTLSLAPSYPTFTELAKDVAATPEPVEIEQSGNGEDVETTLPPYRLESDIPVVIIGGAPEPVLENVHPVYSNPSLRGVSPEVL
ncbi:hypothetical protein QYM36_004283 [Artemia franciscana]|nr:hypothetical protein QYM36_004283 [Artemia franciscana]